MTSVRIWMSTSALLISFSRCLVTYQMLLLLLGSTSTGGYQRGRGRGINGLAKYVDCFEFDKALIVVIQLIN